MKEVKIVSRKCWNTTDRFYDVRAHAADFILMDTIILRNTLENCKIIRDAFVKIGHKDITEKDLERNEL